MEQRNESERWRSYSNEQNTSGDYNQRNRNYRDYDDDYRQDYDRNRDLNENDRYSNNDWNNSRYGRNRFGNEDYSGYGDYGRNRSSNSGYSKGDYNSEYGRSMSGNDNSRREYNNYGDYNRNQDYGRFNRSQDYGRNRGYGGYNDRGSNGDRRERGWWDKTKDEVSSWFGDEDAERRRNRDERWANSHRGKGPKDYKRSQERIREDISDRLSDAYDVDASEIDVKVEGTEVTLSGQVNSKYEKRRAEDIAEDVSGASNVQNNLRVSSGCQNESSQWGNIDTGNTGTSGLSSSSGTSSTKTKA